MTQLNNIKVGEDDVVIILRSDRSVDSYISLENADGTVKDIGEVALVGLGVSWALKNEEFRRNLALRAKDRVEKILKEKANGDS
jgi:hypothetical protein